MLEIIVSVSLTLSIIAIFESKNLSDYIDEENIYVERLIKEIEENKELYKEQLSQISKLSGELENLRINSSRNKNDLEEKVTKLYERWDIISDDRITSIPKNHKDWWDAKEIINQPITKIWKPKGLSQSKDSIIGKHNSYVEEELEINQDFTNIDDSLLDDILDDEDEADSSSSSSSTQIQKPKPKKKTTQRKM